MAIDVSERLPVRIRHDFFDFRSPSWFPPQRNRKPRCDPRRRGFTYEGLGTSVSSGEGGLEVRLGPFGCTSVAAALADARVFGSVPGSSHLQSGENNPQRNFIRLMALTSQTRCARH